MIPVNLLPENALMADDADLDLFFTLVRAETRWFEGLDDRVHAAHGVHLASYDVLRVIDSVDGCRVQDIVREIGITVGAASKSVDRLEAAGLAERRANPGDRRSSLLSPTAAGRRLLDDATPTVAGGVRDRLARLAPADRSALVSALAALRATFAEDEA
jgi:DNA-binding MarR family transcriptional regulator